MVQCPRDRDRLAKRIAGPDDEAEFQLVVQALARSKALLARVARAPITPKLAAETAAVLADVRAGAEAREGIRSFFEKRKPSW